MKILSAFAVSILSLLAVNGCRPMTPEDRAWNERFMQEQARKNAETYEQQMANIRASQQPIPLPETPRTCTTSIVAGQALTNCY